jgi:hypothetical protein
MVVAKSRQIIYRLNKMIGHNMGCFLKPERRELIKNLSFVGYATGQNNIKGRDAVRGYYEKLIAQVIDISHLAPSPQG